jgi:hypothetical protein
MSDVSQSVATPAAAPPPASPVAVPTGPISSRDAASLLGKLRESAPPAEAAEQAPAETNSEPAVTAEPEDNATAAAERPDGEDDTQQTDPAAEPSIEPPRSWTKEEKQLFSTFPREAQQKIADTEQAREKAFLSRQEEQANARKAAEAEKGTYEQKRAEYEAALPTLMSMLAEQQAGEFADVKTWDDVQRMAEEDLPRYMRWEVHNKRMTAVQGEMQTANARQAQENTAKFANWSAEQDRLFEEKAPEFKDPKQVEKSRTEIRNYLKEIGFKDEEVGGAWSGKHGLSLRDHRAQLIIRDAARWRSAEAARKAAEVRKTPPVQRPGVTQTKGEGRQEIVADARAKLERSGSVKDAVALLRAGRRAS